MFFYESVIYASASNLRRTYGAASMYTVVYAIP